MHRLVEGGFGGLRIEKITVNNFGKYDFKEVSLNKYDGSVVVVSGRNGAGKSTLFVESLAWCLFGDAWRGVSADDVIRDGMAECIVRLETDKGVIERKKRRGKGSVVYVNGNVVSDVDLRTLVRMSKDIFFNAVVFGSALSGFLFLEDSDKKEILADIAYGGVDVVLEKLNEKRLESQRELDSIRRRLESCRGEIESIKTLLEGCLKGLNNCKDVSGDLGAVDKELEQIRSSLEALDIEERRDRELWSSLQREYSSLSSQLSSLKGKIAFLESKKAEVEESMRKLEEENKCYVCHRPITSEEVAKLRDSLTCNITDELSMVLGKVRELQESINACNEKLRAVKERLDRYVAIREELRGRERSLLVLQKRLQQSVAERDRLLAEIRVYQSQLQRLNEGLGELTTKERDLALLVKACEFLSNAVKEYKAEIFSKVLGMFEVVGNDFLKSLTDRFSVELDYGVGGKKKVVERFLLKIKDFRREVSFSRLSGGEKRIVVLALNLAMNYILSKLYADDWNVLVFDEVFDGLDIVVREKVLNLLIDMAMHLKKTIVVISHEDYDPCVGVEVLKLS